jgi:hypothetical protein
MAHSPRTVTVLGHDQGREPCRVRSSTAPLPTIQGTPTSRPDSVEQYNITTVLFVSLRRRRSEPSRETSCFLLHDDPYGRAIGEQYRSNAFTTNG